MTEQMEIFASHAIGLANGYGLHGVERRVYLVLSGHYGRENAIPMPELAALVGISTRKVQTCIEKLIKQHKIFIGSSCVPGSNGYYLITDDKDRRIARGNIARRMVSLAVRYRTLERDPEVSRLLGQLELKLLEVQS